MAQPNIQNLGRSTFPPLSVLCLLITETLAQVLFLVFSSLALSLWNQALKFWVVLSLSPLLS
jgi:hypothetical protein